MANEKSDQYSAKETKARFEAALRGARVTGPKPMKTKPKMSVVPIKKKSGK